MINAYYTGDDSEQTESSDRRMLFRTDQLTMDMSNPRLFLLLSSVNSHSIHYGLPNETALASRMVGSDVGGNAVYTGVSIGLLVVAAMGLVLLCFTGFAYATKRFHASVGPAPRHRHSSIPTSSTPLISSISAADAVATAETMFSIQNTDPKGNRYQRLSGSQSSITSEENGRKRIEEAFSAGTMYQYSHTKNAWVPSRVNAMTALLPENELTV